MPVNDVCLYFVLAPISRKVKIGTTRNIRARLSTMRSCSPEWLELLAFVHIPADSALWWEKIIHRQFEKDRDHGEWYTMEFLTEEYIADIVLNEENFDARQSMFSSPIHSKT